MLRLTGKTGWITRTGGETITKESLLCDIWESGDIDGASNPKLLIHFINTRLQQDMAILKKDKITVTKRGKGHELRPPTASASLSRHSRAGYPA